MILQIALAFENCVDLAHAPLAFLYSDFVWGLCGSKVTRKTQPFKRKCNQQYACMIKMRAHIELCITKKNLMCVLFRLPHLLPREPRMAEALYPKDPPPSYESQVTV